MTATKTRFRYPESNPIWTDRKYLEGTGDPTPLFDRTTHFGTIEEDSQGYIVSHARFRDFDHYRTTVQDMLPIPGDREDGKLAAGNEHWRASGQGEAWTYGQTREETQDQWRRGLAPGDWARDLYRSTMDSLRAEMISAGVGRCTTNKRKRVRAYAGGGLSVPRYLDARQTGKPAPVFNRLSRNAQRSIVRLGVSVSMNCGESREQFIRTAAMVGTLVEQFEALGYGVEIVGMHLSMVDCCKETRWSPCGLHLGGLKAGRRRWVGESFPIKAAGQRFDSEKLLSICQAGTLRDLGFRAQWCMHGVSTSGRGRSKSVPASILDEIVKVDMLVQHAWDRGGAAGTARMLTGKINQFAD